MGIFNKEFVKSGSFGDLSASAPLVLIPENTELDAVISDAGYKAGYMGAEDKIKITWDVTSAEYRGRRVAQTLNVLDSNAKTYFRDQNILRAIDIAGGGLLGDSTDERPSEELIRKALIGISGTIKIGVYDINGRTGNTAQTLAVYKRKQETSYSDDDDVPF